MIGSASSETGSSPNKLRSRFDTSCEPTNFSRQTPRTRDVPSNMERNPPTTPTVRPCDDPDAHSGRGRTWTVEVGGKCIADFDTRAEARAYRDRKSVV